LPANRTVDHLRRIEPGGDINTAATKTSSIVELRGGGRIFASGIAVASEKCRLDWSGGETLSLPVDLVRAIRFDAAASSVDFDKALATPSAEFDRVFIKDEAGKLGSMMGLIDSLDAERLKISVAGQDHSILRARLLGIVVAQPAAAETPPLCLVAFRDGSLL